MIRITIDDNKEVEIKTTKGLEETELAANAAIEIMRNAINQHKPKDDNKCNLVLTWIDEYHRLNAVKEIKENLDLYLKDAKNIVDYYISNNGNNNNDAILLTGSKDEVTKVAKKFDSSKYVKVYIPKR